MAASSSSTLSNRKRIKINQPRPSNSGTAHQRASAVDRRIAGDKLWKPAEVFTLLAFAVADPRGSAAADKGGQN